MDLEILQIASDTKNQKSLKNPNDKFSWRDTYLNISSKLTESRPTQFYIDRQVVPKIRLYPTPNTT